MTKYVTRWSISCNLRNSFCLSFPSFYLCYWITSTWCCFARPRLLYQIYSRTNFRKPLGYNIWSQNINMWKQWVEGTSFIYLFIANNFTHLLKTATPLSFIYKQTFYSTTFWRQQHTFISLFYKHFTLLSSEDSSTTFIYLSELGPQKYQQIKCFLKGCFKTKLHHLRI